MKDPNLSRLMRRILEIGGYPIEGDAVQNDQGRPKDLLAPSRDHGIQ